MLYFIQANHCCWSKPSKACSNASYHSTIEIADGACIGARACMSVSENSTVSNESCKGPQACMGMRGKLHESLHAIDYLRCISIHSLILPLFASTARLVWNVQYLSGYVSYNSCAGKGACSKMIGQGLLVSAMLRVFNLTIPLYNTIRGRWFIQLSGLLFV